MVTGDIFTSPIDFALNEVMKRFEGLNDENSRIIYEGLKRSKALWEHIKIYRLNIYNKSYEEFCEECEKKRNIIFLSDDELENFAKAIEIIKIMEH